MQNLKNNIIICDIDGTISILGDRHYRDMTTVFNDNVNTVVRDIVRAFSDTHSIVFMTGRRESARQDTLRWFKHHNIPNDLLIMKSEDETLRNAEFKDRAYRDILKHNPDTKVTLALDDYHEVIKLWKSKGIKTVKIPSVHKT